MKLVLHPLVNLDVFDAMSFYERKGGTQLAADFFLEFARVKDRIVDRPLSFMSLTVRSDERGLTVFLSMLFLASSQITFLFL